jgi:hypothetical protein
LDQRTPNNNNLFDPRRSESMAPRARTRGVTKSGALTPEARDLIE